MFESVFTETQSAADLRQMADDMGLTKPLVELLVVSITGLYSSERFRYRYQYILNSAGQPNEQDWLPAVDDVAAARAVVEFSEALEVGPPLTNTQNMYQLMSVGYRT